MAGIKREIINVQQIILIVSAHPNRSGERNMFQDHDNYFRYYKYMRELKSQVSLLPFPLIKLST